ncbi:unnamed protein product [Auanema sp. JU1783]|nr:unnamed protein product [Auanema sp. JU1783]
MVLGLGLVQVSLCVAGVPLVLLLVVVPLLIYFFPHLMQHLFFLNFRRMPMTDYENVTANSVKSIGRSFYLDGEQGKIGTWHVLPASISNKFKESGIQPSDQEIEDLIKKERFPVFLYAHGNSFDRTISHRCELYNVLSDQDYHVIAFDYRGYGDSEGSPTEDGIVADTRTVYEYALKHIGSNTLIIWGHSMGTGVSTRLVQQLSNEGKAPDGLVLEAAFNNLHDVVVNHPFSIPLRWMSSKMFDSLIVNPLRSAGLIMESDKRITEITCPILIMHADDDHVIPARLGRLLAESAERAGRDVEYVEFDAKREFKHKFIYLAPELPQIVRDFVRKCERVKHSM